MIRLGCLVFVVVASWLVGCSQEGTPTAEDWMKAQKAKPNIKEFVPPTPFVAQVYDVGAYTDPFASDKIRSQLPIEDLTQKADSEFSKEALLQLKRAKEPLESYALSSMNYVGILRTKTSNIALLRVNNLVLQVKVGQYLGKDFGRITDITDERITVRELVLSGDEWKEQVSTLRLPSATSF
jgi:type IV pilus assembly protein PilP